jgi:hypothetical protein
MKFCARLEAGLGSALALGLASFAAPTARAQSTWVVDAAMGPGAQFADLPAAVTAARDGDLVFVRRGVYSMTTVGKSLRLVGAPGAELRSHTRSDTLRIANIAVGREVSLSGFVISDGSSPFLGRAPIAITIEDCAGAVHLQSVTLVGGWDSSAIRVARCLAVTLNECALRPGLAVEASRVLLTRCTVRGGGNNLGTGIYVSASTVEVAQCDVEGSAASGHAAAFSGIRADSGIVIVRGDGASRIAGGATGGQILVPAIADPSWHLSTLFLDPSVTILGAVEGFANQNVRRLPALYASGGALGGSLSIELYSPAQRPFLVLGSRIEVPQALVSWSDLWLDVAFLFVIGSGVQGGSEHAVFLETVPAHPELIGWTIAFQALSAEVGLELSNAVAVVLR